MSKCIVPGCDTDLAPAWIVCPACSNPVPDETGRTTANLPQTWALRQLLTAWELDAIEAHDAYQTGRARGPVTALPSLDDALGGWLPQGTNVIHAAAGAGKTAFALQVAAECGAPCLYVTAEMAPLELFRRHTARVTGTYLGKFKRGNIAPAESLRLAQQAALAAPELAITDATTAALDPANLNALAALAKGESRYLLVVIDSVHSWVKGLQGEASEYDALGEGLAALRSLAAKQSCTILAIAERNRESRNKGGQAASAGSRSFEYSAESVLELHREVTKEGEEVAPDVNGDVNVTLRISKSRHGAQGKRVQLIFNGSLQRWSEA